MPRLNNRSKNHRRLLIIAGLGVLLVASLACNLFASAPDLQATLAAIRATQTSLSALSANLTVQPVSAPTLSEGTDPAQLPTATAAATSAPGVDPAPSPTGAAPGTSPSAGRDERLMKSARILLFEDMSASRHIRLAKEALDRDDYFYLDVGSATGWFKSQLLSGTDWDLVIAAGEAERGFGGEYFEYLNDHLKNGGALILETWDLDSAPMGARPLLESCGVSVQSDWFEPVLRVFFWTDPAHPLFNDPNRLPGLRNARPLWTGDVGDLMALDDANDLGAAPAQILASTNAGWNQDHGLLVSCADGRMVLQTFRSHEYHHDDIVALWQNYIVNTLQNHFIHTGQTPPPVAATASALPAATPQITREATPGPDYTFPHPCTDALSARLLRAPVLQKDLFEHHALGVFLILAVELANQGQAPIQVWDGDYAVEATVQGRPVSYPLHRAATGYLFIDQPTNLYQDLIQPGETWRTNLVFDIDPAASDQVFVLRPGFEFNQTACEVRIPLDR